MYLAPKATMIQLIKPGIIDRRDRGLQRPWGSEGGHVLPRNKPEQLRGPLSPYHARPATKEDVMTRTQVFVGIDISKAQLDLALRPEGRSLLPTMRPDLLRFSNV